MARFVPCGFPGRDDPNDAFVVPVAMADDQDPRVGAEAKDDEAVLSLGIVRVRDDQSGIVIEYCLGLLEAHAMLILGILCAQCAFRFSWDTIGIRFLRFFYDSLLELH